MPEKQLVEFAKNWDFNRYRRDQADEEAVSKVIDTLKPKENELTVEQLMFQAFMRGAAWTLSKLHKKTELRQDTLKNVA